MGSHFGADIYFVGLLVQPFDPESLARVGINRAGVSFGIEVGRLNQADFLAGTGIYDTKLASGAGPQRKTGVRVILARIDTVASPVE